MSVNILTDISDNNHPNSTVSCRAYDLYVDNNIYDQNQQSGSPGAVLSKNNSNELVWTSSADLNTNMESFFINRTSPYVFPIPSTILEFNNIINDDPSNYQLQVDGSVRVLSAGLYYVDFNFSQCLVSNDSTRQSFTIARDVTLPTNIKYIETPRTQQAAVNGIVNVNNTCVCTLAANEILYVESARSSGVGTISVGAEANTCSLMITKFRSF